MTKPPLITRIKGIYPWEVNHELANATEADYIFESNQNDWTDELREGTLPLVDKWISGVKWEEYIYPPGASRERCWRAEVLDQFGRKCVFIVYKNALMEDVVP